MRGTGFDEPAVAAIRGGGIERAADVDGAGLHVAHQFDDTADVLHGTRFDDTDVVDHCCAECVGGFGRHDDLAAIRPDQLLVLCQGV
ncbi:MAG: hypothetical protein B7X10_03025 [Burkholderiales bacterium 21-58-4]|nr:MAG: hypothetical protein B7X10_03025 [Burkholderiales bacterium 21-58-4]